ncbi:MAG: gamma-glutamyltransferase, partial [Longimicrobiales bacterium]
MSRSVNAGTVARVLLAISLAGVGSPLFAIQDAAAPVRATHGMVVSETVAASEIGAAVLAAGGNAVDAAIATGL